MFKVQSIRQPWDIKTVYAADYNSHMFLIAQPWGEFLWVDINDYYLYKE